MKQKTIKRATGRPTKTPWDKKKKISISLDKYITEKLYKVLPNKKVSQFINTRLREVLFNEIDYAVLQRDICVKKKEYWEYEIKRLKTAKTLEKQTRLRKW